jgi:DNA-binding transcriptional regulator YhcF (GntR family)
MRTVVGDATLFCAARGSGVVSAGRSNSGSVDGVLMSLQWGFSADTVQGPKARRPPILPCKYTTRGELRFANRVHRHNWAKLRRRGESQVFFKVKHGRRIGSPRLSSRLLKYRTRVPKKSIRLTIDSNSAVPPFEQVRRGILDRVRSGKLLPGTRLPTVRSLAKELRLATNTVARAYRALDSDEIIETRGRNGSFVRASGGGGRPQAQLAALEYAQRIHELGVDKDDALSIVSVALRR